MPPDEEMIGPKTGVEVAENALYRVDWNMSLRHDSYYITSGSLLNGRFSSPYSSALLPHG
jgi:hypothetical protein